MQNFKLLLVEDNEDDHAQVIHYLDTIAKGQYSLDWARTPDEARAFFARGSHDVCLLDCHLGSINGLMLVPEAPELGFKGPIIVLTEKNDSRLDADALRAGAVDYLVKPNLNAEQLARAIRYAVARRDMEAERLKRLHAEEKNRAKSEFLAHLSHEIRTPLTAILGYTDLLLRHNSLSDDLDALRIIERNGQHLLSLLNDVLDLSKIEAGKLDIEFQALPLVAFLTEIYALISVAAQEKGLELNFYALSSLPASIKTDSTRLRQILLNLLGNAVKFTQQGGIELCLSMLVLNKKEYLHFAIRDTGIGISAEDMNKLFIPFSQAGDSAASQYQGTGLGLAISRQLVQRLGGEINAESVRGEGSQFNFYIDPGALDEVPKLPLDISPSVDTAELFIQKKVLKGKILVVDDLPDIRKLVGYLITSAGGQVSFARHGEEAVEKVLRAEEDVPFDLVIMDMQMPRMNGMTATRRLRQLGYERPIIALTAATLCGERERYLAVGCNDHVSKPFDRSMLLQVIQQHLSSYKLQDAKPGNNKAVINKDSNRKTLLLVEDHADARNATKLLLQNLGWRVRGAATGHEALDLVNKWEPAVVLMDICLPDTDGYSLVTKLRHAGLTSTRFIALSGYAPEPLQMQKSQFDCHLLKPIRMAELIRVLGAVE